MTLSPGAHKSPKSPEAKKALVRQWIHQIPMESAAEWDQSANEAFRAALKEGHWDEIAGKTVTRGEDRQFSFNPRLSNVPESVAALDPAFWHPEAPATKSAVRKEAQPGK